MSKKTHPLIPFGRFCYRMENVAPGEVLSRERDRYGKDLREYPYHKGTKAVLCPYWQATDHGTGRCEFLGVEHLDEEQGHALALFLRRSTTSGPITYASEIGHSFDLPDEYKICGVNEDDDDEDVDAGGAS